MKHYLLGIIGIVLHAAFFCAAAPKIEIEGSKKVDFGKYPANQRKEAVFRIKNTGDASLIIGDIRKTCGCAEVKIDTKRIEPGKTAELTAVVLPDSIYGPYSKNIYVESNDPKMKFLELTHAGNAIPIAVVKPKDMLFAGRIQSGVTWKQEFLIEPSEKGVELGAPLAECTYPVSLELKREDEKYRLLFGFTPENGYKDDLNCKLKIPVLKPSGWKDIEITIAGKIGFSMFIIPSTLYLPEKVEDEITLAHFSIRIAGMKEVDLNPDMISWRKANGVDFSFGTSSGDTLPVTGIFTKEFIKGLTSTETHEIEFTFRNDVRAVLKLKSAP